MGVTLAVDRMEYEQLTEEIKRAMQRSARDDVLDRRACAFDRIGERIVKDSLTKSEYDSEIEGQMSFADFPEVMP